jgi:hypothetical protein
MSHLLIVQGNRIRQINSSHLLHNAYIGPMRMEVRDFLKRDGYDNKSRS